MSPEGGKTRRANGDVSESLHVGLQSRLRRAFLSLSDIFLSESLVFINLPKSNTGRSGVDCSCGGGSDPKVDTEEEAGMREGADARGLPLFHVVFLGGALDLGAVSTRRRFLLPSSSLSLDRRVPASLVLLFSLKGFGLGGPGVGAAIATYEQWLSEGMVKDTLKVLTKPDRWSWGGMCTVSYEGANQRVVLVVGERVARLLDA